MINYLNNLSIKNKLIGIITTITVVSIVIIVSYFVWTDLNFYKESLKENTEAVATIVGNNIISELNWGDTNDGEKALRSLQTINNVKYAEVFKKDNVLFASYNSLKTASFPNFKPIEGKSVFNNGYLYVFKPIIHDNIKYGSILIVASTEALNERITIYAIRALIFSIFLILITVVIANRLQKIISDPIVKLSNVVEGVSENHDYSVNISKKNKDEVGILFDGFNQLMKQVNTRNKEIQTSRTFLINVLDSIPLAVIALNKDDIVTHWNKFAETISGVNRIGAVDRNIYDITSDFDKFADHHLDVLQKGEHFVFNRIQFSFSKEKYYRVTLYPLVASEGMIMMMDDVTELEKKEMQLRQVQKMETVGTLAGGLAHDFNNVLGGITGAMSLINFKIHRGVKIPQDELASQLDIIEKSTDRAAGVVQKLLTLSRSNAVLFSEVDLNLVIKDTLAIIENSMDKSIEINCHYFEEEAKAIADGDQIGQVLLNLLINAGHAMTIMKGKQEIWGGVINVSLEFLKIGEYFKKQYSKATHNEYWVITVADSGVGMNNETVKKIFDPFFTTKEKEKGTGLGLAMSYNIIEQHEGFIDIYSESGVGSTFKVFLPVLKHKTLLDEKIEGKRYYEGTGLLLIVDDDSQIRSVATEILEECGYEIIIAKDGIEALEKFSERIDEIKLVLLDLVMPKLDGKHTFIRLKEMKDGVKVLLSSGFQQDSRVKEILDLGVAGFIQKPYTFTKLSEAVYKIIESK